LDLVVVLSNPQNLVNVASVVRAMKNFGLRDLRLANPEQELDSKRITGIAHGSDDIIKRIEVFDGINDALADRTYIVGMTARGRAAKRNMQWPREAAAELLAAANDGKAALMLGREDRGLTNDELDLCHRIVTIPTAPDYAALNLSHAFAVMAYELFVASTESEFKRPRRESEPPTQADFERLFASAEDALVAVEFFKGRNSSHILRMVREVAYRTPMDAREVRMFKAMCTEVVKYLDRMGLR
jgi:tRNA (cytidine32/uridine32-2'-O)-methyltransferase